MSDEQKVCSSSSRARPRDNSRETPTGLGHCMNGTEWETRPREKIWQIQLDIGYGFRHGAARRKWGSMCARRRELGNVSLSRRRENLFQLRLGKLQKATQKWDQCSETGTAPAEDTRHKIVSACRAGRSRSSMTKADKHINRSRSDRGR